MKRCLLHISLALLAAGNTFGLAWGAPATGAELASACTACHGTGGRSDGAIASLAGMTPARFRARMHAFQHGEGTIMNRIAPGYDDDDITALARYFAAQPVGDADDHATR